MQQLAVGSVLGLLVLALLYFDSGHSTGNYKHVKLKGPDDPEHPALTRQQDSVADGEAIDTTMCRALARMQVCSHRASLGAADARSITLLLERMSRLAADGITCFDLDVVRTSDGQLVVGYPAHLVAELKAAGREVPPATAGSDSGAGGDTSAGGLEAVPWSEYVAGGLAERHPLLGHVFDVFARIANGQAGGSGAGGAAGSGGAAGGEGGGGGGGGGAAGALRETQGQAQAQAAGQEAQVQVVGQQAAEQQQQPQAGAAAGQRQDAQQGHQLPADGALEAVDSAGVTVTTTGEVGRRLLQLQQQQGQQQQGQQEQQRGQQQRGQQQQGQQQQAQQQQAQQQDGQAPPVAGPAPGALLLIELKGTAMGAPAALTLLNATRALGMERRVGLWLLRRPSAAAASAEVAAQLVGPRGGGVLRVLGLPDSSRGPNGTAVSLPLALQPDDADAYDMFGPSVRHSDGALAAVAEAAGSPRRVVTWTVDSTGDALRAARAGAGIVVTNDPVQMERWRRGVVDRCGGLAAAPAEAAAASVGAGAGAGATVKDSGAGGGGGGSGQAGGR